MCIIFVGEKIGFSLENDTTLRVNMIVMAIVVMVFYVGANGYIFWRMLQLMQGAPIVVRVLFGILFWVAAFGMFLSLGLRDVALPETLHRVLYVVGTSWLVFTLYMFAALLLTDLIHWIWPAFQYGVWWALVVTVVVLECGYINYRRPRIERLTIETEKPVEGGRMRIVAISDVHLGRGTTRSDLARYVDMINAQEPDMVVIVGDLIDNSIVPVEAADMCREFERVEARYGIYMSAGNHEYISGIEACRRYLATTPVQLLTDSVVEHPSGIRIVSRDDRTNSQRDSLSRLLAEDKTERFTLVLDHQPTSIKESSRHGVDLHLSGHTHRGQVWPISLATDAMFDQSHGYRRWDATHTYVMSGLSLWGPPFRIGTQSELLVIDVVNCEI